MEKDFLAGRLKNVMLKTVQYKDLAAKSGPRPARNTSRLRGKRSYLSTHLGRMDDGDDIEFEIKVVFKNENQLFAKTFWSF